MSLKDVPVGRYKAKAAGGSFKQIGDKQTPAVQIGFEFEYDGKREHCRGTWFLTETICSNKKTVIENTMDVLVGKLGWNEDKPLLTNADGSCFFDHTFFPDKEVEIVIELSDDGEHKNVAWVNTLGGGNLGGSPIHVVAPGLNLKAAAAAARARVGVKAPSQPVAPDARFSNDTLF